jgi:hypothetical protein
VGANFGEMKRIIALLALARHFPMTGTFFCRLRQSSGSDSGLIVLAYDGVV